MIRLILIAIGVFLIWVLFLSSFSKRQKISICIVAIVLCALGLWFDQSSRTPQENIISLEEITDCGVKATHSYRTNFDIEFCLRNLSSNATAKRVAMSFIALDCIDGDCEERQIVNKDISVSIEPQTEVMLKESLSFDLVEAESESVVWVAKVSSVKAIR